MVGRRCRRFSLRHALLASSSDVFGQRPGLAGARDRACPADDHCHPAGTRCGKRPRLSSDVHCHPAGTRPGRRIPFGRRQKESKTSLNVHQCVRLHRRLARCVHLLAALRRNTAPSVHARRDQDHGALWEDEARRQARRATPHGEWCRHLALGTWHLALGTWQSAIGNRHSCRLRLRPKGGAGGSVLQSAPCTPVPTPVHGWGSISGQCRQRVNTPC
jgi:hypothetical protein